MRWSLHVISWAIAGLSLLIPTNAHPLSKEGKVPTDKAAGLVKRAFQAALGQPKSSRLGSTKFNAKTQVPKRRLLAQNHANGHAPSSEEPGDKAISNGSVSRKDDRTKNGQSGLVRVNGANGKINGYGGGGGNPVNHPTDLAQPLPPTEAAAHTYMQGRISMNVDDLSAQARKTYVSNGIRDRREVTGRIAASAAATTFGNGAVSTAKGSVQVAAMMDNAAGTKGCINCKLPGHPDPILVTSAGRGSPVTIAAISRKGPIKIDNKPGCTDCTLPGENPVRIEQGPGAAVTVKATNKNPHNGPITIKAENNGPGSTSAAASNVIRRRAWLYDDLDEWETHQARAMLVGRPLYLM